MTDVWWLDQILAPLYGTLTVLRVDAAQEASDEGIPCPNDLSAR
jgi:hypothetical protein